MLYAYTRVSTLAQATDGESLPVQGRQCEGWAMMRGESIADTYVERGVSGSISFRDRPAGAKLWERVRRGDVIVAAKLDRMFRDSLDALQCVEECKASGVSLVLLDLGTDPVTNGLSELFLTIVAAFAKMERARIRERVQQSKADAKSRGRYLGGSAPFGYVVGEGGTLQPVEGEQAILATIHTERRSGCSLRAIRTTIAERFGRTLSLDALARIVREG